MINILVVDDSGVTRLQVKQMLKQTNCTIFEAINGKQVLQNMFSANYSLKDMDLVLLDIYLGEIDGYKVLEHIVANHPNLPVIMMSMERKKESVLKCIEMGAKDYLLKPFNRETLISRIERFYDILAKDQAGDMDIKALDNVLLDEVDRANRAGTSFTTFALEINSQKGLSEKNIVDLRNNLKKILRKIDSVFIYNKHVVLVLPFTNHEGIEVIKNKIISIFKEAGISCLEEVNQKIFFYPDDLQEKELIKNYNINAIKDVILNKLGIEPVRKVKTLGDHK